MATIKVKNSVTSGSNPTGLTFGELAVNITDKKIYIGNAVGSTITLHDQNNVVTSVNGRTGNVQGVSAAVAGTGISVSGATGNVTITNAGVVSLNGSTGSLIGFVKNDGTTPFLTQAQPFNAGLSATSGCSFNNATVYITNSSAVDPLHVAHSSANALKVSTTGQARTGSIRLGNAATATQNTFISQTDGTMTFYNGLSTTGGNMISFSSSAITVPTTISGATFSGLFRSTSGISASGAITGGSYIYAESGFRVGSSAINSQTGTTYSLLAADNGEIIVWSTASAGTLTIPSGLPVGFNATLIQTGTAAIGITGSGTTLNSFEGKLRTAGQHAAVSIISYSSNVFNIAGGLTG